jgi:hypothetical protein
MFRPQHSFPSRSLGCEWIVRPALALNTMGPMAVLACHCGSTSINNASCIILQPPCRFKRLQCLLDLAFTSLLARQQLIHSMHLTIIMIIYDVVFFRHRRWGFSRFWSSSVKTNICSLFLTYLQRRTTQSIMQLRRQYMNSFISSGSVEELWDFV